MGVSALHLVEFTAYLVDAVFFLENIVVLIVGVHIEDDVPGRICYH